MKRFLSLSVFAMISAGIYGFADMAHDLYKGTMIRYDKGDHGQQLVVQEAGKLFFRNHHIGLVFPEKKSVVKQAKVVEQKSVLAQIDYEDFSRAEPEIEELLPINPSDSVWAIETILTPVDSTVTHTVSDSTQTVSASGL